MSHAHADRESGPGIAVRVAAREMNPQISCHLLWRETVAQPLLSPI
jgi:hypothetical protein